MVIKIIVFIVFLFIKIQSLTKFHVVAISAVRLFKKHMDDGHTMDRKMRSTKNCEYCKTRMKENENENSAA